VVERPKSASGRVIGPG